MTGRKMERQHVLGLIATGEGYKLDFKVRPPADLGKHICAFSNASGGKIILGVADNGTTPGYALTNQDEGKISDTARNLVPPVRVAVEKVGEFAVIHIPEGENKPHSSGGHYYLRVGSTSQQMSRDELRAFFVKERLLRFDEKPNLKFDFAKDFNREKFKKYLEKANITQLEDEMDTLANLNLLDGEYMRNAGVLLFTDYVKKFFISADVTCLLYQGNTKTVILDRKEFDSDILSNFENALNYIKSKLNTNFIIKSQRTEKLELPEDSLREALINAMVHRDYFSNGHVQVDIYFDRVDISNPGGLVSGLPRKDLGKRSMPRNPILMDLLQRIDHVEKAGSGIKRIRDGMKAYGLKAKFDINEGFFSVLFPRAVQSAEGSATPKTTPITTPKTLLELIQANPNVSKEDLAQKIGITVDGVKYHIKRLHKTVGLKWVGPSKGGHWEIKNK